MNDIESSDETDAMDGREITLPDGRYMIFYTFGSAGGSPLANVESRRPAPAGDALPSPDAAAPEPKNV